MYIMQVRGLRSVVNLKTFRNTKMAIFGGGFFKIQKEEVDPGKVKGTELQVLKYPNPKLRTENQQVSIFDDKLKVLADEMLLVMYAANGIGLAAPQVGVNKKIMVFNEKGSSSKNETEMILVNPSIVERSSETDLMEEGCLSFPQIHGQVRRHVWVRVQYSNVLGQATECTLRGLPARIFQHEFDHLDKVLFIDRMEMEDRESNRKRLDKYVKKYGAGGLP